MSYSEATKVVQVGETFPGVDIFHAAMARSDIPFELEAIATTNPDLRGKLFGETRFGGPSELDGVPFIGVVDAIEKTDAPVVLSALEDKLVGRYQTRLASGRLLVASASLGRTSPDMPVVSAFVNGGHIDELFARDMEGRAIDGGGSLAALISVPLAPLHREFGIVDMSVTSLQGWSDTGMHGVPELVDETRTEAHAIDESRHQELRSDINRLLGESVDRPADIDITALRLQHGPWVRGHHARIAVTLGKDAGKKELEALWRHFEVSGAIEDVKPQIKAISRLGKEKWPGRHDKVRPVKLEHGDLISSHATPSKLSRIYPMRVGAHIVEFDPDDDPRRLVFEVSGDNLIQGAVGGNLLNMIYAQAQGYLS